MKDNDKIRLRTDVELDNQAKGLVEMKQILNKLSIPYFLGGGTLLGVIRDGDFIAWDWDVEIDVKTEDIFEKKNELVNSLICEGFEILKTDDTYKNFKINAKKYGAVYEILGYYKKDDMRYRYYFKIPDFFFQKAGLVTLRGETYPTLYPQEDYLEFTYGDWKTPLRTSNKSDYLSENTTIKHHWCAVLAAKIVNKIKRYFNYFF